MSREGKGSYLAHVVVSILIAVPALIGEMMDEGGNATEERGEERRERGKRRDEERQRDG